MYGNGERTRNPFVLNSSNYLVIVLQYSQVVVVLDLRVDTWWYGGVNLSMIGKHNISRMRNECDVW